MGVDVFEYRRRVQFSDTDMAGIVHFAVFFRYMEEAEHAFLRSLGFSVAERRENGLGWPRIAATCDYHSPARFEDELTIRVDVERLTRKSATYGFTMQRDAVRLATGSVTAVCCRISPTEGLKSVEIPPEIAESLRRHLRDQTISDAADADGRAS
ncbi:MAG: acyl-CoA thioesterase [Planctomycetia bacterium]